MEQPLHNNHHHHQHLSQQPLQTNRLSITPTTPASQQTTPPSPLYQQPSTYPHHKHRLTFISANAAIFVPATARCDRTASLQADAGVCSPCRVFGSRDSMTSTTSALRAESEVRGQRCRVDDFHNVRSPRRVRGQRSEVRDRRTNSVSPALYKPTQCTKRCQSGGVGEPSGAWRSPELGAFSRWRGSGIAEETRAGSVAKPAVPRRPARSCGESRRELASQRQTVRGDRASAQFEYR